MKAFLQVIDGHEHLVDGFWSLDLDDMVIKYNGLRENPEESSTDPLEFALFHKHLEAVEKCLLKNVPITGRAIYVAATMYNKVYLNKLLSHPQIELNAIFEDIFGRQVTPLTSAIFNGQPLAAERLVKAGASIQSVSCEVFHGDDALTMLLKYVQGIYCNSPNISTLIGMIKLVKVLLSRTEYITNETKEAVKRIEWMYKLPPLTNWYITHVRLPDGENIYKHMKLCHQAVNDVIVMLEKW